MPLFRYFAGIGGILLAAMLLANAYLPPAAPQSNAPGIDRSTIRITSSHNTTPGRVVIDTSLPTIVPPAASPVMASVTPHQLPRKVSESFAQLAPAAEIPEAAQEPKHTPRVRRRRAIAVVRPVQEPRQVAGIFGPAWFR